jgi:trans-aconitate methyltransferase
MEYISKYLPQELQGCDTMLDLGCGDGVNTLRIKDILKIKEVIGYDKNKNLIARARRRGIEAYQLDIEEVPDEFWHKYKEKRVCCTLWGVLHHLASPFSKDEFIRLIKDCLPSASLIEYKKVSGKKVLFAIQ